jgi:hypothetical protein
MLSNVGDAASGTLGIIIGGADATQFQVASTTCAAALQPGAACAIYVKFHPTSRLAKTGNLQVTSISGGGPVVGMLAGRGRGAQLVWNPTSLDFGRVTVGGATAEITSTLTNAGEIATGTLGFSTVPSSGSGVNDFFISYGTCGATLAPGASCSEVFQGSPGAAGARTAVFDAHAMPGGQARLTLTVTGVP